jgi:hypothetical protein
MVLHNRIFCTKNKKKRNNFITQETFIFLVMNYESKVEIQTLFCQRTNVAWQKVVLAHNMK